MDGEDSEGGKPIYSCNANQSVENVSSENTSLTMNDKPENVVFISNSSRKEVCAGIFVNLTCTANANPPAHTYLLYENDEVIQSSDNAGIWIRRLNKGGNFTYRCKVNNSFRGIDESKNLTFTVRVPPSFRQAINESGV